MRVEFSFAKNIKEAQDEYPWATVIMLVAGGLLCFESWDDYVKLTKHRWIGDEERIYSHNIGRHHG